MSRYRGAKLRIVRRLGILPNLTSKTSKKLSRPGQHGKNTTDNNKTITQYGLRLNEKQKLKFNYGLTEHQLYNYLKEARRRKGVTSLILIQLLEMRLDTICYNLGFGPTIAACRQLVNHRHITVNGKIVNIPSFQCRIKDIISINSEFLSKNISKNTLSTSTPAYLEFDISNLKAKIINYCDRQDILLKLDELLVIEYYSRR